MGSSTAHVELTPGITPATTPMMAQWLALRAEADAAAAGCLLFFRMGDFYELFFDDARRAAATLDIALTTRGEHLGTPIPMCGVPVHSHGAYLARLVKAGHAIAIAEQTEDPKAAKARGGKSVVARGIVRLVTAGTLTEDHLLAGRAANWVAAAIHLPDGAALAWADISTGGFGVEACTAEQLPDLLARLAPAELIAAEGLALPGATLLPRARFDSARATAALCAHFAVAALDGFGSFSRAELAAMGALLGHVQAAARGGAVRLDPPRQRLAAETMAMDAATRASLEITRTAGGDRAGSLLDCVDHTITGAGARLLADDLAAPLACRARIDARLDIVGWFASDAQVAGHLRDGLRAAPDFARALGRIGAGRGAPRDLAAVRDGLAAATAIRALLIDASAAGAPALLAQTLGEIADFADLADLLRRALPDTPPAAGDAGAIASGYDTALDDLRIMAHDTRRAMTVLEGRLRAQTGVAVLKVKHNNVIGYHVEVQQRAADPLMAAGSGFHHRQTLAGTMRFDTDDLRTLASRIAQAHAHALAAEAAHLETLNAAVLDNAAGIARAAAALARLDVSAALADVARQRDWHRPVLLAEPGLHITQGRHPVVEAALLAGGKAFVPNDCVAQGDTRVWLLTGPNMGGKSTFLRQTALIAVLAQAGSFVPAAAARLGVVDRLFSRVGASDNLAAGRSTFMVEMVETAAILRGATANSLVILDEIGRGTSTFDGLALAWAILEALHDTLGARALFASHYHELTGLSPRLASLALRHMKVREWQGDLVFLHQVAAGAAPGSYGLAVARLAGVPAAVLARAAAVLALLEAGRHRGTVGALADLPLFSVAVPPAPVAPPEDRLRARLAGIAPDDPSPRDALALIYELRTLAG
jgi:DNA mismatch repair protein MutS